MDSTEPTREQLEREAADLRRQLAESAALSESVIAQSPIPMAIARPTGELTYNSACAEQLMFAAEPGFKQGINLFEMKRTWQDYDTDGNPLSVEQLPLARALRGETTRDLEIRTVRADGSERWELVNASPIYNDDGELIAGFVSFSDITARKQAAEALRVNEERLDLAMSVANDGIYDWDFSTGSVYFNPRYFTMAGYEPDGFPGTYEEWAKRVHPEDLVGAEAALKAYLAGESQKYDAEFRFKREDGQWMWIRARNKIVDRDDSGAPQRIVGTHTDITARKRAEAELRRLAAILGSTSDMVSTASPDGRITYINRAGRELLGWDGDVDKLSKRIFDAHPEWAQDMISDEGLPEASCSGLWRGETALLAPDGAEIPVSQVIMSHKSRAGDVEYYSTIIRDISDRKRAEAQREHLEEQLLQAQKMEAIGQLAGGIAHDFNNILTAIHGNAELLKMDLPDEGQPALFTGEIMKGASRAADLTRQLLAFARKGKWRIVPVDIHDIITQTVNMLKHTIDRRIEIRLELRASPSTVMGDPTQLQNAMLNMGVNARDAMGDGGTLTYATRNVTLTRTDCDKHPFELTPGDFLEVRIVDTGEGMDSQTIKRIFEPFFTTKEVGKGTGLGLAGTYGCIRNHDGCISVASQPGRGATFTTLLPLADSRTKATERTLPSDAPLRGTGCVLIVDDEESVCNFVRTSLENLGYTVSVCKDGAVGVDYYRRHHHEIDLVILDLIMPKMSGQDAFSEMKKINPDVKALVSSGYSHPQTTNQMLDEGVLAMLNKPYRITELAEAVARYTRRDSL